MTFDGAGNQTSKNGVPFAAPNALNQPTDAGITYDDDRNRFMSPDLGRFLQPDPIGFKGDASNLYRYCGNDWANRSDLMGLQGPQSPNQQSDGNNLEGFVDSDGCFNITSMENPTATTPADGAQGGSTVIRSATGGNGSSVVPVGASSGSGAAASGGNASANGGGGPAGSGSSGSGSGSGNSGGGNAPGGGNASQTRLAVGNPIDAHFISQFGFKGEEAKGMVQLAKGFDRFALAATVPLAVAAAPAVVSLGGMAAGAGKVAGAAAVTYGLTHPNQSLEMVQWATGAH